MSNKDLIVQISNAIEAPYDDAEKILGIIIDNLVEHCQRSASEEIEIEGFGSFAYKASESFGSIDLESGQRTNSGTLLTYRRFLQFRLDKKLFDQFKETGLKVKFQAAEEFSSGEIIGELKLPTE